MSPTFSSFAMKFKTSTVHLVVSTSYRSTTILQISLTGRGSFSTCQMYAPNSSKPKYIVLFRFKIATSSFRQQETWSLDCLTMVDRFIGVSFSLACVFRHLDQLADVG